MHAGRAELSQVRMLRISAKGVVTLLANFPTHVIPYGVEICQFGSEDFFGITPNTDFTFTFVNARCVWAGFTNEMAVF